MPSKILTIDFFLTFSKKRALCIPDPAYFKNTILKSYLLAHLPVIIVYFLR